jgi:hypothetical protein
LAYCTLSTSVKRIVGDAVNISDAELAVGEMAILVIDPIVAGENAMHPAHWKIEDAEDVKFPSRSNTQEPVTGSSSEAQLDHARPDQIKKGTRG